jgi:hypothetical protein
MSYFHLRFPESTCSRAYQVSDGFLVQPIWVNKSLRMMCLLKSGQFYIFQNAQIGSNMKLCMIQHFGVNNSLKLKVHRRKVVHI